MNKLRQVLTSALLVAGASGIAGAQSLVGRWNGSTSTQQGTQSVTFTFDSLATGWKGSWSADTYGAGPLSDVTLKADTVSFSLSIENTLIEMQGTLSADRKSMAGYIWIGGSDGGTFKVAHAEAVKSPPTGR